MRWSVAFSCVSVALLSLGGPAQSYSGNLGASSGAANYVAYYDDAYGPFYNGYWSSAGEFFYTAAPGRPYMRDDARHFRKDMVTGFHPVQGFGPGLSGERVAAQRVAAEAEAMGPVSQ